MEEQLTITEKELIEDYMQEISGLLISIKSKIEPSAEELAKQAADACTGEIDW